MKQLTSILVILTLWYSAMAQQSKATKSSKATTTTTTNTAQPGAVQQAAGGAPIKVGSVINYTAHYQGSDYPYIVTVAHLADSVVLNWDVAGYGTGKYFMPAKSLESATNFYADIPRPDATTTTSEKETALCISRAALTDLVTKKSTVYSGDTYAVITTPNEPYVVAGVTYNVLHLMSAKSKHELWIMNNPAFPLICKSVNSPSGSDVTLNSIK